MNILQKLKARKRDMKILSDLIDSSLARSADAGEPLAGAHQLAVSAFEMPDGGAEKALASLGTSSGSFLVALSSLEASTLAELGLEVPAIDATTIPRTRLDKTDATFEAAIKAIYDFHNEAGDYRPLTGAHVLAGVATVEHGVSARVFASMNVERSAVIGACRATARTRPSRS